MRISDWSSDVCSSDLHPQGVADQVADIDAAAVFEIGGASLESDQMGMVQPQFGGVFDRDEAFAFGNAVGKNVQQSGLARSGAAGYHDVLAAAHTQVQELGHGGIDRAGPDQVGHAQIGRAHV